MNITTRGLKNNPNRSLIDPNSSYMRDIRKTRILHDPALSNSLSWIHLYGSLMSLIDAKPMACPAFPTNRPGGFAHLRPKHESMSQTFFLIKRGKQLLNLATSILLKAASQYRVITLST